MKEKKAIAKLLAMIVTDGCVTGSEKKLKIRFTNKSKSLHRIFQQLITKITRNKFRLITFEDKNNVITSEVNSNVLGRKIRKLLGEQKILPKFVMDLDNLTLKEVAQLMFSCDGSPVFTVKFDKKKRIWRLVRRVKFFSKNRRLLLQMKSMLKKLGFSPQISKTEIILERRKDIEKFWKEIRFVPGIKMSKHSRWNMLTKNEVLDMITKSFATSGTN